MSENARTSGFTVLEAMVAMAVLLIGAAGMASIQTMGSRMNGDARVMTRAAAIAQDLVNQIQTWNYVTDARLANVSTANDADFADAADAFEATTLATNAYDHEETELAAGPWNGIPTATVAEQGFTRYWNVAPSVDDATGAVLGLKVAVIVRWDRGGAPRRIVLTTYVRDPGVTVN